MAAQQGMEGGMVCNVGVWGQTMTIAIAIAIAIAVAITIAVVVVVVGIRVTNSNLRLTNQSKEVTLCEDRDTLAQIQDTKLFGYLDAVCLLLSVLSF
ncbi:hypothetical protein FACS189472_18160 [Alphaproteobacteria bacterium]|nr:hypothetical protein FACS189472_18160 [Alphaproteobacteria bacterium]